MKTLKEFDMSRLQNVKTEYVKQLASCDFIRRNKNIVILETGNTHLITAIGSKACILEYKFLFYNASTLASELKEARSDYQL